MTSFSRAVAVIAGMIGLVVAAAACVRAIVLAADGTASWPVGGWWTRLISSEPRTAATIAAALTAVAAAALLVLAARQLGARARGTELVEFGGEAGSARLEVPALALALRRHLEASCPGVKTGVLTLDKVGDGWQARLEAELPARDLAGTRRRLAQVAAADLARAGGLRLDGLDLVVTGLLPLAGTAGQGQKEDLGMARSS